MGKEFDVYFQKARESHVRSHQKRAFEVGCRFCFLLSLFFDLTLTLTLTLAVVTLSLPWSLSRVTPGSLRILSVFGVSNRQEVPSFRVYGSRYLATWPYQ